MKCSAEPGAVQEYGDDRTKQLMRNGARIAVEQTTTVCCAYVVRVRRGADAERYGLQGMIIIISLLCVRGASIHSSPC
jgi:hypothetical protein